MCLFFIAMIQSRIFAFFYFAVDEIAPPPLIAATKKNNNNKGTPEPLYIVSASSSTNKSTVFCSRAAQLLLSVRTGDFTLSHHHSLEST